MSTRGAGVSAHIILRSTGEKERKEENLVTIISTRCKRKRGGRSGEREKISLNYNGAGERIRKEEIYRAI